MKKLKLISFITIILVLKITNTNAQNAILKGKWQLTELHLTGMKGKPNLILNDTLGMLSELLRCYKLDDSTKEFTLKDSLDAKDEIKTFYFMGKMIIEYDGVKNYKVFGIDDKKNLTKGSYSYNLKQKKFIGISIEKGKQKKEIVTVEIIENKLIMTNEQSKTTYQKVE